MKRLKSTITSCIIYFISLLASSTVWAQPKSAVDTGIHEFTLADFQGFVLANHPIVKQAQLLSAAARARVTQSLGKFDPKLSAEFARKEFGNTEYYNNWHSELKVPLWLAGADLKATYDRNVGTYTDPMLRTGDDGLAGLGLNIPIGQGFFIDERRNILKQSKAMVQYAEAEQVKQILSVWIDAVKSYWDWYYAYSQYTLMKEGVQLAQLRYDAVARQADLGDKPGIDSVEASITVLDRRMQLAKLEVELQNTRLLLSNNLWSNDEEPLELPASAVPQMVGDTFTLPSTAHLDSLLDYAADAHPELQKLRSKGLQLDIERSYRREMLKPKLNLSGSLITSRNTLGSYYPEYYDVNWNNYKVGVDFSFPLFLRYERGKLKEVKFKRLEVDYALQQTDREIKNNITTAYNALKAYEAQLSIQLVSISNQRRLLKAELQKFDMGESTLFVINSRETKLIDMRIKRASMISSYHQKLAELYYKAGLAGNMEP